MKYTSRLRKATVIVFFLVFAFASSQALAASGVYPVAPEKGIQSISYTISGANLSSYNDTMDPGLGRLYRGTLGTGTLRAQGTVTANEYLRTARIFVSIQLGGGVDSNLESEIQLDLGASEQKNFDVSVAIPVVLTDAIKTYGANVAISVVVDRYIGENGPSAGRLTVSAIIDAPPSTPGNHAPTVSLNFTPAQPVVGSPINFVASAADADGDTLIYAWYLDGALQSGATTTTVNWSQPSVGAHALKVVVSDGKGGEADATASFTVTNPGAEPYVIAPGYQEGEGEAWGFVDKVTINGQDVAGITKTLLYTGSRIKTGPGVEIILRTSSGAVIRVKSDTTYETAVRDFQPSRREVIGRLVDGVSEFYWPTGHAGAAKFRVDTNRVVVGIKGTTFAVSQINDVSTVSVQEGVVQVTNLDTGAVTQVGAGQSLTAANTGGYVNGAYNYYIPFFSSTNGNWTGLGLANNNSGATARAQVTVYNQQGSRLSTTKKLIAAGGQESLPVTGAPNATGWMLVNAHQPLSGLAFIGFNGSKVLMADIPFVAELATNLVIPHVAQDVTWDTSILICNPNNTQVDVDLELVDEAGWSQGIESMKLPALGSGEYQLATLFPGATRKKGKVLVTAHSDVVTAKVAAFALYNDLKNGGAYYAGINAVAEEPDFRLSTPTFSYYLPFFSSENGNWTGLGLANPDIFGTTEAQIKIFNEAGTVQAGNTVTVPIWGQLALPLAPPTVSRGWIQVDANGPLSGLAFIGTGGYPSLMADIPFVESLSRKLVVPHVAQDTTWDTTLLLCNPDARAAASVQIVSQNLLGEVSGTVNRVIAALGSASYGLSSLFPGHPKISGKIELTSSTGLAGFALYSNKKSGGSYFAGINAEAND
ncbi:FecR domain-containing protein [bacterium]|nr:FecR domain-containing protein [bacterium]